MIPNIGGPELVIALVIILLLFGAKRIPELAKGLGTNLSYNLFDLIGGSGQQQQGAQTTSPQEQIDQAEKHLQENPKDPEAIKNLAALYYQDGRLEEAARVLERGREVAPRDEEIAILLGQVYSGQAQMASGEGQKNLYDKAGGAYAAAAKIEPDNKDAYLLAGQAYDQAGEPAQAIKYYNEYLDREPEGEQARAVKERISALLEGGMTTENTQP